MDRKALMKFIDGKMQEIYEALDDHIRTLDENNEENSESESEIGIESDEDGDYLDKDGNIYDPETQKCIGEKKNGKKTFFKNI